MPKVGQLGESMMRGNANNFYIRCDDDLDDQDCNTNRGAQEYPHIHVVTDGPSRWDNIVYIGITFGGYRTNIDIYNNDAYVISFEKAVAKISKHCSLISGERIHPLTQYLFGYYRNIVHQ